MDFWSRTDSVLANCPARRLRGRSRGSEAHFFCTPWSCTRRGEEKSSILTSDHTCAGKTPKALVMDLSGNKVSIKRIWPVGTAKLEL